MEKRRSLSLSAGILNIIAYAIYILLTMFLGYVTFIAIALIIDLNATASVNIYSIIGSCVVRLILAIISIVMSAKIIKLSKASVQDYNAAKSKILSVIIINFIVVAYGLISYLISGISADLLLISIGEILMFAIMLIVAILLIVDINKNKKLANQEQASIIAGSQTTVEPTIQPAIQPSLPVEPATPDDKVEKLERLNELKANGLISQEEYEKLKADIIK